MKTINSPKNPRNLRSLQNSKPSVSPDVPPRAGVECREQVYISDFVSKAPRTLAPRTLPSPVLNAPGSIKRPPAGLRRSPGLVLAISTTHVVLNAGESREGSLDIHGEALCVTGEHAVNSYKNRAGDYLHFPGLKVTAYVDFFNRTDNIRLINPDLEIMNSKGIRLVKVKDKHIMVQGGPNSCVPTAAAMLCLDLHPTGKLPVFDILDSSCPDSNSNEIENSYRFIPPERTLSVLKIPDADALVAHFRNGGKSLIAPVVCHAMVLDHVENDRDRTATLRDPMSGNMFQCPLSDIKLHYDHVFGSIS